MQYTIVSDLLWLTLLVFICTIFVRAFLKKGRHYLFSPLVFFSLYLLYYIIIPYKTVKVDFITGETIEGKEMLLFGAILMLISFILGANAPIKKNYFSRTISIYKGRNNVAIALIIFVIAFVANGLMLGFSLSFIASQMLEGEVSSGDPNYSHMYLTYLTSLFPACICLMLSQKKKWTALGMLLIASAIYLISGFRFRLLVMVIPVFLVIHLYPKPRNINWKLWLPLALMFYISMGIIEGTRRYTGGLDLENFDISSISITETRPSESGFVYSFSARAMDAYSDRPLLLFEPVMTALLMPLPRAIFPWKPDGGYPGEANMVVYNTTEYGNAFLNITEAYISFSWIGIIIYGLVIGFISKIFWITYLRNKDSIAAIILLGVYNGVLYIIVSRGYMPQPFTFYVYYILIFCWLSRFINFQLNKYGKKFGMTV